MKLNEKNQKINIGKKWITCWINREFEYKLWNDIINTI